MNNWANLIVFSDHQCCTWVNKLDSASYVYKKMTYLNGFLHRGFAQIF